MERAFPDPRLRRIVNRLIRWAYRSADACLAISDGVARGLVEDYDVDPSRLHVIPNPVDLDTLRADANRPAPTGLPERFIAGVGRLDHQKGFDLLLEAFARLDDPDLELVLVGRGPEEGALKAQAEKLGVGNRVHFPGFVEHPAAIVSRAEIFCLSSRWEGFGHVIVEAMAVGCPVVVCDCEFGPAEIVEHGNTGLLVPPEDVDALAKALIRLLSNRDEAERLAEHALKRAEDFGSKRIAENYWELLSHTEESP
jgi:glycosyltransferase involved in cell wall biosynthesis